MMAPRVVVLPMPEFSDGDSKHWPAAGERQKMMQNPTLYLEKIATMWMKEKGEAEPGVIYQFASLPKGYAVFEQQRLKDPKHVDKRLFGFHRKYFDSPNRYFPHFLHVMKNGGESEGCPCTVCVAGKKQGSGTMGPGSTRSAPRTSRNDAPLDDEGNVDVYRHLIEQLKTKLKMDEPIKEPTTMDWRTTKKDVGVMRKKCLEQPAWLPRTGEMVLFVPDLDEQHELVAEAGTGQVVVRHRTENRVIGSPAWQSGVVTEMSAEELDEGDLVESQPRSVGLNYSGVRIESMPDPNSADKSLSKQHKYVPVHQIRPLAFWKHLLQGTSEEEWHPTLFNSLTAFASFCLLDKYRFRGVWPRAAILCNGIYLGSELIFVGDVVRLFPPQENAPSLTSRPGDYPIVHITSIELHLDQLDDALDNPLSSTVAITGIAYTTNAAFSYVEASGVSVNDRLPTVMADYVNADIPLYPIHPPGKRVRVPFHRILGRCYESVAMHRWFRVPAPASDGSLVPHPIISFGHEDVQQAQMFSQAELNRLTEAVERKESVAADTAADDAETVILDGPDDSSINGVGSKSVTTSSDVQPKKWFWADTRVEQLDLLTVNGYDVGKADHSRDPKSWRKEISKLLESRSPSEAPTQEMAPAPPSLSGTDGDRASIVSRPGLDRAGVVAGRSVTDVTEGSVHKRALSLSPSTHSQGESADGTKKRRIEDSTAIFV